MRGCHCGTRYTAAGRTDLSSALGAAGEDDDDVAWVKSIYDDAGRQVATFDNYDRSGGAQLQVYGFESAEPDGFTTSALSPLIVAGASATADSTAARTGRASLSITTTTTQNHGVSKALSGSFAAGRTYKGTIWVKGATAGQSYGLYLGTSAAYAETQASSTGAWQRIDVTWTPGTTYATGVVLAFRANRGQSSANSVLLDDASAWDNGSPDRNIPTSTVYDLNGQPIASVLPPGIVGEAAPTTLTDYDEMGRVTSVTGNHVAGGGTSAADVNVATSYGYDDLGRQVTVTDPKGITTSFGLDRLGRTTLTIQNAVDGIHVPAIPDEDVRSTYAYNDLGELLGVCAPKQLAAGCDPSSATEVRAWHYAYDGWGNLAKQTPPVNQTLTHLSVRAWSYDASNRLTSVCDYPDTGTSRWISTASRVHAAPLTSPRTTWGRHQHGRNDASDGAGRRH